MIMMQQKPQRLLASHHEAADADELKIDATDAAENKIR
jgi:hypothetical protein